MLSGEWLDIWLPMGSSELILFFILLACAVLTFLIKLSSS